MDERRRLIVRRLEDDGFRIAAEDDESVVLHRRRPSLSRVGMLDSVVVIRSMTGHATTSDLVDHEEGAVAEALRLKTWIPRGLFSAVEVFPVTLADDAEGEAVDFVCNSIRNRWALMSMPAVVHEGGGTVDTFQGRKLWGGAYVQGLRRRLLDWVA
jgi:hypothetical protein